MQYIEINGLPPTVAQLYRAATINYGHFTSMQVRDRAVRGLELHVQRLKHATYELFGADLDDAHVRGLIKTALREQRDASVRVTVFAGAGGLGPAERASAPEIMVTVTDPVSDKAQDPWAVRTAHYVRDLPHLKHVATMGLIRQWRAAVSDGFDDALFFDRDGRISEGSAWNLALWDGSGFTWPSAGQLAGITMQLLQTALSERGVASRSRPVRREELDGFRGALATYSHCPAQPLARIDAVRFSGNTEAEEVMRAAWDTIETATL